MNNERFSQLIDAWRDNDLSEDQAEELNTILRESEEARRIFSSESQLHGLLHCAAAEDAVERVADISAATLLDGSRVLRRNWGATWLMFVSAIAAGLIVAVGIQWWRLSSAPTPVATLQSSENAAWESTLPTTPGSELTPGLLSLRSGVATIRFHSGAEVVVEAPAQLELVSKMKAKLISGAAVIDVPDSAIGFVVETPDGYAIDYGTRFAVRVDEEIHRSDFELIEGEIEVHSDSGSSLRLNEAGGTATVSGQSVRMVDLLMDDLQIDGDNPESKTNVIRVATQGRSGTAMRRPNKRHRFIDPELLSVKHTKSGKWDYRSFFSFDLGEFAPLDVSSARLRLNLVPSQRGVASRWPDVNRFEVYGLANATKFNWKIESTWEESPGPEDGVLLGTFDVPRSQQRGSFGIANEALLNFIRKHSDRPMTFIIVRQTSLLVGEGIGPTHTFASDSHPESVGPLLELSTQ